MTRFLSILLLSALTASALLVVGCTSADPSPAASPAAFTAAVPRPTMPTRQTVPAIYTVAIDVTVTNSTTTNLVRLQGVLTNAP